MALVLADYITKVRQYLRESNASQSFWSDTFLTNIFNARYKKRCAELVMAFEGFFRHEATTPIVQQQRFYDWPDGFQRLHKMELLSSSGTRYPIARWERHGTISSKVFGNVVPNYRPVDGGFVLEPPPDFGVTGNGRKIIESFDAVVTSPNYSVTDCAIANITDINTIKEGTGCIVVASVTGNNPKVTKTLETPVALSDSSKVVGTWVFVPKLVGAPTFPLVFITLRVGATNSIYLVTTSSLHLGWNNIEFNVDTPWSGSRPVGAITEVEILWAQTTNTTGLCWDAVYIADTSDSAAEWSLVLEYAGVPTDLVTGASLSVEFPKIYEELLVLDTAIAAMAAEGILEGGQVRALLRERVEFEEGFERFVNQRMVSRQRIEPFIPHYQDA